MACQSNEIWLEATWCKHYDKSLSHEPTRGLMVINHHFGERKMTAIKIMNGMINFFTLKIKSYERYHQIFEPP